jgi:excisionase family DNA binding protein
MLCLPRLTLTFLKLVMYSWASKGGGEMTLLRVEDLEQDSRISRHTWRAWIRQGRLPVIRAGRRIRVEEAEYRAFLDACRVPARQISVR